MCKILNYTFLKSTAIKLLFISLICKFLSGAFLPNEFVDTGIFLSNSGLLTTILLLILAVITEVIKTPPAKRDENGTLIIYETEEDLTDL